MNKCWGTRAKRLQLSLTPSWQCHTSLIPPSLNILSWKKSEDPEKKIWNSLIPSVFRNPHPCGDSYPRHRWRHSPGSQQHLLSGWFCDRRSGRNVSPDLEIWHPPPPSSHWHLTLERHKATQQLFGNDRRHGEDAIFRKYGHNQLLFRDTFWHFSDSWVFHTVSGSISLWRV